MEASLITVVHDGDVLREALDEADLLFREGSAAGSHYVGDAHLVHHHNVHVAFYKDAAVLLCYLALCKIDSKEVFALYVNLRFRGVYVFCGVVTLEGTAAVGNHAPAHGVDGEHHPLTELVNEGAVFLLDGKACGNKEFILVTGCTCGLHKGGLTGRSPAKAPLFNGGVLYSALTVIAVTNRAAFSGLELVLEELTGKFRYRHQALMALAGGNLLCGFLLFLNLYIIFLCKIAEGFRVREMVIIHKETHGASGLAAAEALVDAL